MADSPAPSETDEPSYELPNDKVNEIFGKRYTYPYQECQPLTDEMSVPEEFVSTNEEGQKEVCIWQNAQGCAPEGELFTEWGSCEVAMTTSARFYKNPGPKFESDPAVAEDPEYKKESEWVWGKSVTADACCHDAQVNDVQKNFATAFDVSAPGIWTDTFTDFGLLTAAGIIDTELLGAAFDPKTNFGFDRSKLIFPSTDIARMKAFFMGEIERRKLSDERIKEVVDAVPLRFAGLYTNYAGETTACEEGVGVADDGTVSWGNQEARYVYVLKADARNVADPPGLDRPDGTMWRLDAGKDQTFKSGEIIYGEVPMNARQDIPKDGQPEALVKGTEYKLFILRDFDHSVNETVPQPNVKG